jgi:hypothetical protein
VIGKADQRADVTRSNDKTPGPCAYEPYLTDAFNRTGGAIGKRQRHITFDDTKGNYLMGPGKYSWEKQPYRKAPESRFGSSLRRTNLNSSFENPGPGAYDVVNRDRVSENRDAPKFSVGHDARNDRNSTARALGVPGVGNYDLRDSMPTTGRSYSIGKEDRRNPNKKKFGRASPGPGDYDLRPVVPDVK